MQRVPFFGFAGQHPASDEPREDGTIPVPPPIPQPAHPGVPPPIPQPAQPFPGEPLDAPAEPPTTQPGDPGAEPPAANLMQEDGYRDPLMEVADSLVVEIRKAMQSRDRMELAFAGQISAATYTIKIISSGLNKLHAEDRGFLHVLINDLRHEAADLVMQLDAAKLREAAKELAGSAAVN